MLTLEFNPNDDLMLVDSARGTSVLLAQTKPPRRIPERTLLVALSTATTFSPTERVSTKNMLTKWVETNHTPSRPITGAIAGHLHLSNPQTLTKRFGPPSVIHAKKTSGVCHYSIISLPDLVSQKTHHYVQENHNQSTRLRWLLTTPDDNVAPAVRELTMPSSAHSPERPFSFCEEGNHSNSYGTRRNYPSSPYMGDKWNEKFRELWNPGFPNMQRIGEDMRFASQNGLGEEYFNWFTSNISVRERLEYFKEMEHCFTQQDRDSLEFQFMVTA